MTWKICGYLENCHHNECKIARKQRLGQQHVKKLFTAQKYCYFDSPLYNYKVRYASRSRAGLYIDAILSIVSTYTVNCIDTVLYPLSIHPSLVFL